MMNISSLSTFNTHNGNFTKNFPITTKTHHFFRASKTGYVSISQWNPTRKLQLSANCISPHQLKKTEAEAMKNNVEEDETMEKWAGRCIGEVGNMVALMECLEREAIMGDDDGKDASDYNRRALIFQKSDRVFQSLKENNADAVLSS